jgi:hypothetical protein
VRLSCSLRKEELEVGKILWKSASCATHHDASLLIMIPDMV